MKFSLMLILSSNLLSLAHAREYVEIGSCGSATVLEGNNCTNEKVEFKFEGCQNNLKNKMATIIKCDGEAILARFQQNEFRSEAHFSKSDDGWGEVSWKLDAPIKQFQSEAAMKKPVAKKEQKVIPKIDVSPAKMEKKESIITATPVTAEASPFKYSAFVDIRYTNYHIKDNPTVSSGNSESGFGLEDGALYANYEKGDLAVIMDIPIRRSKDFDINGSAAKPNESSNNNFTIGGDKAQLYVHYKVSPSFILNLGQFDTIFGVELNDSKDRFFGKTGLVYDQTLPVTHTGFMTEYSFSPAFYLKAFAANPNNKGTYGSSANGDEKIEVGGAFGFINDNFHFQLGSMTRSIRKASALSMGKRTLYDGIVGGSWGKFSYDFEYSRIVDPNKNTLSPSNPNDSEKAAEAFLALFSFKITPQFSVGSRIEHVRNDPTGASIISSSDAGLSIHYKALAELELRSEYVAYKNKNTIGTSWNESRFNFASVITF